MHTPPPRRLRGVALSTTLLLLTAGGVSLVGVSAATADTPTRTVCAEGCDYTTIQAAVGVSSPEDIVEVHVGEYTLDGELELEDVSLVAIGAVTVTGNGKIKPMRTGNNPLNSIKGFIFDGVTIDSGPGEDALIISGNTFLNFTGAAISNGDPKSELESLSWTIEDNVFTGGATAIQLSRTTKLTISGNIITGTSSDAIVITNSIPASPRGTISGNTISDGEAGGIKIVDSVDLTILNNVLRNLPAFGIRRHNTAPLGFIDPPAETAGTSLIRDNVLTNTGTTGTDAAGIVFAGADYLAATEVTYNKVNGSAIGVLFAADTTNDLATFAVLHYNDFSDNTLGVSGEGSAQVDATLNWWGAADGGGSGRVVTTPGEVDYVPYATSADFSTMSSGKVLTVGADETYTTIQEAIDNAAPGDTIEVLPGDYDLTAGLTINQSVHLIGPMDEINPVTDEGERGTGEATLSSTSACTSDSDCSAIALIGTTSNITISGFSFDNVTIQSNVGSGGTDIKSVLVSNNIFVDAYNAIRGNGGPDWVVTNNLFQGVGKTAVFLNHAKNIEVTGNAVLNPAAKPSYGAFILTAAENFSVVGNTVENTTNHGTNVETFSGDNLIADNVYTDVLGDPAGYGAIRLKGGTGSDGTLSITGNMVSGSRAAVVLKSSTTDDLTVGIHSNDLSDNTLGVENLGTAVVNADLNWWGSAEPDFDALVDGDVTTESWYLNAAMTTSSDEGTTPEDDGTATATPEKPIVVVEPGDNPVDVTVTDGTDNPAVDYSALQDEDGVVVVPAATKMTTSDGYGIQFRENTTVTPSDPSWDGVIKAPTVVPNSSVTIPAKSGTTVTIATAIEVGAGDIGLTFDEGVRVLLPDDSDKLVGFVRNSTFTPITTKCAADSQTVGDALAAGGDCYLSVGADMVIWTKHFTTFVAYSSVAALAATGAAGVLPLALGAMLLLVLGSALLVATRSRRRKALAGVS